MPMFVLYKATISWVPVIYANHLDTFLLFCDFTATDQIYEVYRQID